VSHLTNEKYPNYVCAKTASVGWPIKPNSWISAFLNFLSSTCCFRKCFKLVYRNKCGYGSYNHHYNVSPIRLHALLGVRNFTKVVHVCTDRLWSGLPLPEVWETLLYSVK
jgi:hypothetical protein